MAGAGFSGYLRAACAASMMAAAVACPAAAQPSSDEVELSRVTPQAARLAIIVAVNHQPVEGRELATLYLALYTLREGQAVPLAVDRDGHTLEFTPTAVSVIGLLASR